MLDHSTESAVPPPVALRTPLLIVKPAPTLIPPNVVAEAVGRTYAGGIEGLSDKSL